MNGRRNRNLFDCFAGGKPDMSMFSCWMRRFLEVKVTGREEDEANSNSEHLRLSLD